MLDGLLMIFHVWEKVSESAMFITVFVTLLTIMLFNNKHSKEENKKELVLPNKDDCVNFDNDVLTSEPLNYREIISSLNNLNPKNSRKTTAVKKTVLPMKMYALCS